MLMVPSVLHVANRCSSSMDQCTPVRIPFPVSTSLHALPWRHGYGPLTARECIAVS